MTRKLELHTYDTWGNAEDGYDVNDICKSGTVEVSDDANQADVIAAFIESGDIGANKVAGLVFDDLCQNSLWIEIESKEDGKPLGRIVEALS